MLLVNLDFFLAECRSEALSTVFIQADRQFCFLALLVWSAGHLPCFLWSCNVFSAYWTFCHDYPFLMIFMVLG